MFKSWALRATLHEKGRSLNKFKLDVYLYRTYLRSYEKHPVKNFKRFPTPRTTSSYVSHIVARNRRCAYLARNKLSSLIWQNHRTVHKMIISSLLSSYLFSSIISRHAEKKKVEGVHFSYFIEHRPLVCKSAYRNQLNVSLYTFI